jgi:cytochrome c553
VSSTDCRLKRAAVTIVVAVLLFSPGKNQALGADIEVIRKKAAVCVPCHGERGNSTNPLIPSLAGQPKQFISTQLVMFREGNRKDPQMSPQSANLSNADIDDFGTYFSTQELVRVGQTTSPDKAASGRRLTEQFKCVQCHGPALMGQQHIPRLAGQQAEYMRMQLRGFKATTRFDMDGNMTSAAQPLSFADIEVLVDYLAGLR